MRFQEGKFRILFFTGLVFCTIIAGAQNPDAVNIRGRIFEQSTKKALPFANISLLNRTLGTISNINGEFKLIVPATCVNDSLMVSYLGFHSIIIKVSDALPEHEFFLAESPHLIKEVVVTGFTAESILKKAIQKIPDNYYSSPYRSSGFYRLVSKSGDEFIHLSEAVFDLWYSDKSIKKSQLKLIKMRSIKDKETLRGIDLGLSAKSIFDFDIVNNSDDWDFLSKNGMKDHTFKLEGTSTFNDREVFVINFDQKENLKKSGYKGKIIIDKESFAFVFLDFGLSPSGIRYNKFGDTKLRALLKLLDIQINVNQNDSQITYRRIGDRYYFSNAGNNTLMSIKSSRRNLGYQANIRVDYLSTAIDTKGQEPFQQDEILRNNKIIEQQDPSFDPAFWEEYNIILPSSDFGSIARKIEIKNSADSLKVQKKRKTK
jgi:hypothetical protein